jgi:hypothetical protein
LDPPDQSLDTLGEVPLLIAIQRWLLTGIMVYSKFNFNGVAEMNVTLSLSPV